MPFRPLWVLVHLNNNKFYYSILVFELLHKVILYFLLMLFDLIFFFLYSSWVFAHNITMRSIHGKAFLTLDCTDQITKSEHITHYRMYSVVKGMRRKMKNITRKKLSKMADCSRYPFYHKKQSLKHIKYRFLVHFWSKSVNGPISSIMMNINPCVHWQWWRQKLFIYKEWVSTNICSGLLGPRLSRPIW